MRKIYAAPMTLVEQKKLEAQWRNDLFDMIYDGVCLLIIGGAIVWFVMNI